MKARFLLALLFCSSAYAVEPDGFPPVIDNSEYPASEAPVNPFPAPQRAPVPAAAPNATLVEMLSRLDRLQTEVQQLNGKLEEQAYQIAELKKRQGTIYADFDERMQAVEGKLSGTVPAPASIPEGAAAEPKAAEPATPEASASVPAAAEPAPADKPAVDEKPKEAEKSAVSAETAPATPSQKQEYDQAYRAFRSGHTDEAIAGFDAFLSKYPTSEFAGKAQYWLGEAHSLKHDNGAASKAFNAVIDSYPNSEKVPDAMVSLASIEIEQKNLPKASELLTRVTTQFPKSKAALSAQKKLKQLGSAN